MSLFHASMYSSNHEKQVRNKVTDYKVVKDEHKNR
jgi:hypothetical protein